jgi:hypothetical protein
MPAVSSFSFPFLVGNVVRLFTGDFEAEVSFPLWRFYLISSSTFIKQYDRLTPPLNLFRFSSSPLAGSPTSFPFTPPATPPPPAGRDEVLFPANLVLALARVIPESTATVDDVLALRFVPLPSTGGSSKAGSIWLSWSDMIEFKRTCMIGDKGTRGEM